jgi:hypothetical protein
VELRYFGGMNVDDISAVIKISPRTIECGWEFSRVNALITRARQRCEVFTTLNADDIVWPEPILVASRP